MAKGPANDIWSEPSVFLMLALIVTDTIIPHPAAGHYKICNAETENV